MSSQSLVQNGVGNAVVGVDGLTAHPRNYNRHGSAQVGDLRRSLRRFGQVRSIVVQATADGTRYLIVAGHGIVTAARAEGIESLRADVIPADWDDAMVLAYLAADNELARQGEPDEAQLAALLRDVQATADRELATLAAGSEARLTEMLATLDGGAEGDAEAQVDRAAELLEKWQVRTGDLWRIGEHRLACGDCTDRAVVERVLQGEKAEVLFTSPPYADVRMYTGNELNTKSLAKFISVFSETAFQVINLGIVRRDDEIIEYWNDYIAEARRAGYKLLSWNVWDKMMAGSIGNQSAMFAIEHEWLFVFGKKSKSLNRTVRKSPESFLRRKSDRLDAKGRHVRSVRQFDGEFRDSTRGQDYAMKNLPSVVQLTPEQKRDMTDKHPAIMPVSLPSVILEAMTTEFDVVADPFLGSGTTLVACQNLDRRGRGIEISPEYCAVVLERMATAFSGIEIERVAPRAKMDLSDEDATK